MNNFSINYDQESDVLYVTFGYPSIGIATEVDDVVVRRNETTGHLIGITIVNFSRQVTSGYHKNGELDVGDEFTESDRQALLVATKARLDTHRKQSAMEVKDES